MMSFIGLAGCIGFLLLTHLAATFPFFGETGPMLTFFTIMVLSPWFGIIWAYFRSIRSVILSPQGITVTSRSKVHSYSWNDIDKICMARTVDAKSAWLSLILIPKAEGDPVVEIDMGDGTTAIRARSYLIREIGRLFREPDYTPRHSLSLASRKVTSY